MGKKKVASGLAVSVFMVVAMTSTFNVLAEAPKAQPTPDFRGLVGSEGTFSVGLFYRTPGIITPPIVEVCTLQVGTTRKVVDLGGGSGCDNDKAEYFAIANGKKAIIGFYDKPCGASDLLDDDFYEYKITAEPLNHEYIYGFFDGNNNPGIPGMVPFKSKYKNGLTGKVSCVIIDPVSVN